ncbi:hypothetical protein EVAR_51274_1 [Eumeta japonica]|uniref:Uncharacterized protein n=1 Tax=Eumeta variegata TaxID=151549 RepID=A0A4C1YCF3_EUMVA|nr:hypothetical protein EVAR_51274_1 [Eumeta japonica]
MTSWTTAGRPWSNAPLSRHSLPIIDLQNAHRLEESAVNRESIASLELYQISGNINTTDEMIHAITSLTSQKCITGECSTQAPTTDGCRWSMSMSILDPKLNLDLHINSVREEPIEIECNHSISDIVDSTRCQKPKRRRRPLGTSVRPTGLAHQTRTITPLIRGRLSLPPLPPVAT